MAAAGLAVQAAPTGALNDTGQTRCLNAAGTALEACSEANSGDASPYPRQDGRFGRDSSAGSPGISGFSKPAGSGGSGGFAFTPLDVNGNAIALTGNPPVPAATPRCIKDNVTNLIWEVKTTSGLQNASSTYGWGVNSTGSCTDSICSSDSYIGAVNLLNLCGETANDWRLPTLPELLSIVDHDRANSPSIDTGYFPNTIGSFYWSATVFAPFPALAWFVSFLNGVAGADGQSNDVRVRLVRSGQ
jgi:hypothetical protein